MAPLILYYDLRSQPCRAVYLLLKVNGIPFTSKIVDLFAGDQLQESFKKVNPVQRVPVIDDNGFILGESAAIFKYLKVKYKLPEHWYPTEDLLKQSRVEEYLHWHHANTRYMAMMLFRHQFINTVRGKPIKQGEVAQFTEQVKKSVKHIDSYFLNDKRFLCGDEISVADVQAACELLQLHATGNDVLFMYNPKPKAWLERVRAELNPQFDECNANSIGMMKKVYEQSATAKM